MAQFHGTLEMLRIERQRLCAANIASNRIKSGPPVSVAGQPLVDPANGNPCFCSQFCQGAMVVETKSS